MKLRLLFLLISSTIMLAQQKPYSADWESLRTHKVPDWAQDAKFGIYAHWGVYSVGGNWDYTKSNWGNYYITAYKGYYSTNENQEQRVLFENNIGPIKEGFGYKDMAKQFKASKFSPSYWADLIEESGAKYAGMCVVHHDGYLMWDSNITDFCAGKLGSKRDLAGELLGELKKRNIKTIASFHHGRTVKHYEKLVKHLLKDPEYKNADLLDPENYNYYWFLGERSRFVKNRLDITMEFIDKYSPDVLWFDGGGGKYDTEKILARFFNNGLKHNKEVCVHNKGNFGSNFGLYSYENGHKRPSFVDWPWEDDTPSALGWCDWQWDKKMQYKKAKDVIVRLCDLVSRNGGLLLSMNPRPDGTFDKGQEELLKGIGKWLKQNGEAIYGTRPWTTYGEGHLEDLFFTQINPGNGAPSRDIQPDTKKFNEEDIRFTQKNGDLYAIALGIPTQRKLLIKSLAIDKEITKENKIENVILLGYGDVQFKRTKLGLEINLPKQLPNKVALSFKIKVKGHLEKVENKGTIRVLPKQT